MSLLWMFLISQLAVGGWTAGHQTKVIIDVDPGIDDFEAMVILINQHIKGKLSIVAIVVSEGNTAQVHGVRNTFRLLEAANVLNIPVFAGTKSPILSHREKHENFFGVDGFGDLQWSKTPKGKLDRTLAPNAIRMFANKYPNRLMYFVLGPMTNLALAMRMYDDVAAKLKGIYAMGGLYRDSAGEIGEFNIMFDPESAEIVFNQLRSPMTLFTWQACTLNTPIRNWFENATINNPVFDIMLRAETALKAMHPDDPTWISCDPMTIVSFVAEESVLKSFESPLEVKLSSVDGRGVVVNYTDTDPEFRRYPVRVIMEMDMNVMKKVFLSAFEQVCDNRRCYWM